MVLGRTPGVPAWINVRLVQASKNNGRVISGADFGNPDGYFSLVEASNSTLFAKLTETGLFGSTVGRLFALDATLGAELWQSNLVRASGGWSCSPWPRPEAPRFFHLDSRGKRRGLQHQGRDLCLRSNLHSAHQMLPGALQAPPSAMVDKK